MYSKSHAYICSIFKFTGGFAISYTQNQDDICIGAYKKNVLQIGLGPRILPKPIIPLANLPFGAYSGVFKGSSLIINRKSIIVNGQVTAEYKGTHTGYINAMLSGYTYLHHHIDISDSEIDTNAYLAIYAYLYYLSD